MIHLSSFGSFQSLMDGKRKNRGDKWAKVMGSVQMKSVDLYELFLPESPLILLLALKLVSGPGDSLLFTFHNRLLFTFHNRLLFTFDHVEPHTGRGRVVWATLVLATILRPHRGQQQRHPGHLVLLVHHQAHPGLVRRHLHSHVSIQLSFLPI